MRPTLKGFKEKALANPEVAQEHEQLCADYAMLKELIKIRQAAGLTQEDIAEILHTKKSNISHLENVHSKISPTLTTIEAYAKAAGYKIEVKFIPQAQ